MFLSIHLLFLQWTLLIDLWFKLLTFPLLFSQEFFRSFISQSLWWFLFHSPHNLNMFIFNVSLIQTSIKSILYHREREKCVCVKKGARKKIKSTPGLFPTTTFFSAAGSRWCHQNHNAITTIRKNYVPG